MTEEKLKRYVFLNDEIKKVSRLMDNFESGQPFYISAGDSQTVEFSIADEDDNEIKKLRESVRTFILGALRDYSNTLYTRFANDGV